MSHDGVRRSSISSTSVLTESRLAVVIEPTEFSLQNVGLEKDSVCAFLVGEHRVDAVNAFCERFNVAFVLVVFWSAAVVVWPLTLFGVLPKSAVWTCVPGLGTPLYIILWYDVAVLRVTLCSVESAFPALCNFVACLMLLFMVEGDERSVGVLWTFVTGMTAPFDDAAHHNNTATSIASFTKTKLTKRFSAVTRNLALKASSLIGLIVSLCVWLAILDDLLKSTRLTEESSLAVFSTGSVLFSSASVLVMLLARIIWVTVRHPNCMVLNRVYLKRVVVPYSALEKPRKVTLTRSSGLHRPGFRVTAVSEDRSLSPTIHKSGDRSGAATKVTPGAVGKESDHSAKNQHHASNGAGRDVENW